MAPVLERDGRRGEQRRQRHAAERCQRKSVATVRDWNNPASETDPSSARHGAGAMRTNRLCGSSRLVASSTRRQWLSAFVGSRASSGKVMLADTGPRPQSHRPQRSPRPSASRSARRPSVLLRVQLVQGRQCADIRLATYSARCSSRPRRTSRVASSSVRVPAAGELAPYLRNGSPRKRGLVLTSLRPTAGTRPPATLRLFSARHRSWAVTSFRSLVGHARCSNQLDCS